MPRARMTLLLAALLSLPAALAAQAGPGLSVRSDPRVELLAIVFRLAGNPEYATGLVPAYNRSIQEHFAAHAQHPAVLEAKRLREQYGVSFDAVMSMAVHIDGVDAPRPRRPFTDPDPSLERRWHAAEAHAFVEKLAAFAHDTRFAEFLAANRSSLDSARARMERVVHANIDVRAIAAFFGREPNGAFIMVPLLTNGPGNFGLRYLEGDREEVYAVIGTAADNFGMPGFDVRNVPTMVHEFSHSFVNPAVAQVQDRFRAAGEAIYPLVAAEMRGQAYGNWQTMINESLVRVSVARLMRAKSGDAAGVREVVAQRARGFLWANELYDLFAEYERDRARYPTLDAFLPRVAEYFDALAPRAAAMVEAYDRLRPSLAAVEPGNGAADVDPALDRIVLRFDRPMAGNVNINTGASGREHYPEVKRFEWNEDHTALTLFVALQPAWSYELVLGGGFRSAEGGVPLRSTPVRFTTRPQELRERLQAKLDSLHAAAAFPGAVLGVALPDGRTLALAVGYADTAAKTPMPSDARLLAGSVGKTFFAALAMQLVHEGRLALEDPIARYLGDAPWFARLPNGRETTVRMLMNHTSGLVRYEFVDAVTRKITAEPDHVWTPAERISYILDGTPPFAAGQGWQYSDTNYIVLGMILQEVLGSDDLYAAVRSRILAPLGLVDIIPSDRRVLPRLVQGYAGANNPFGGRDAMIEDGRMIMNPQMEWTGGGFATAAGDLARWAKLLYEGKAFAPELLPIVLEGTPAPGLGRGAQYGLGVIITQTDLGVSYGHSGFFPGYLAEMRYFPAHRFALALQFNTSVGRAIGRNPGAVLVELAKVVAAGV